MTNLVTQDEFERLFKGKEVRPHVAHQIDVFLASKDYEYYSDVGDGVIKTDRFLKKVERLKYAQREKTGPTASEYASPLAEMHKRWKREDSEGNPKPIRSAKFALGTLYYFFREVRNPKYFLAVIDEIWSPGDYDFQRLYFAKHSASPPWDEFQAVSARFYLPSIAIREGFRDVWSGEPLGPVEQVPLGRFNLLLGIDDNVRARTLETTPSEDLYKNKDPNIFAALNWRAKLSTLYGRDKQLKRLEKWATDGDMCPKIMLISGPGGVGKSRLAAEAVQVVRDKHGWAGGDLPKIIREGDVLNGRGNGVAVVVDYPEEDFDLVERLIKSCQNSETYPCPVRIILASRDNLDAWKKRLNNHSPHNIEEIQFELKPYLNKRDGLALAKEVAANFATEVRRPVPKPQGIEEWRNRKAIHSLPLFLVAAAIHAVLDPKHAFTLSGRELLLRLAEIELKRVLEYSRNVLKDETALQKLLGLSVLTSNGLSTQTVFALGEAGLCDGKSGDALLEAVQKTPYWRVKTDDEPSHLLRLQPDRPAAAFLYLALNLNQPSPVLPRLLADIVPQSVAEFGSILARVALDVSYIDPNASMEIEKTAIKMLDESPELVSSFSLGSFEEKSIFSSEFFAAVYEKLLPYTVRREDKGRILNDLANRLSDLGRNSEALARADEMVEIIGQLVEDQPDEFRPNLARSLETKANIQDKLGLVDEALQVNEAAASIFHQLYEHDPDEYWEDFAQSFHNLSVMLARNNRHSDAVHFAEVAVDTLAQQMRDESSDPPQNLGVSLRNLSTLLYDVDRKLEAFETSEQAMLVHREQANVKPELYQIELARSLDNFSNIISEHGLIEEAAEFGREALEIRNRLAQARPNALDWELAMSLNNVGNREFDLGNNEVALQHFSRSISTFYGLAEANPDVMLPMLGGVLSNVANKLSKSGDNEAALELAQQAEEIWRALTSVWPEKFLTEFSDSMSKVVSLHMNLKRFEDSLPVSVDHIDGLESLAENDPETYLLRYAVALKNHIVILANLDRSHDAMKSSAKVVNVYEILVESDPATYTKDFAEALNVLGIWQSELEQFDAAVESTMASVNLFRDLAKHNPKTHLSNFCFLLDLLAQRYFGTGDLERAKSCSEEAIATFSPYFLEDSDRLKDPMSRYIVFYRDICSQLKVQPDDQLLMPVLSEMEVR